MVLNTSGLDDWSIEAGKIRLNLGSVSNDYGDSFARGIWRHGLTDQLTLEGVLAATAHLRNVELGVAAALPWQVLGSAALATLDGNLGHGRQWMLGMERQGLHTGIFLQAKGASENYRSFGEGTGIRPVELELAGNWTYSDDKFGSLGVGYASSRQFDGSRFDTSSANYSINIGDRASLSLSASRSSGDFSGSTLGVYLIMPLEGSRAITASATRYKDKTESYVSASGSPTKENNWGWRVLAGTQQESERFEGGLYYTGRYGQVTGDVSNSSDQTTYRVSTRGGLVLTDGQLFATRNQNQSMALVEVAGYGDIGVGLGSSVLTRTDADGMALIPNLSPYQRNSVRLDPQDLPVSAEIDSIEQIVIPAWRSVVKVVFPVRSGRGALLRIILDDGEAAPAGAVVAIAGDKQEFYVARRGAAFVTGLQTSNRLKLQWKGQQCEFDVALPPGTPDDIPRLGPLACKGIKR